MATAPAYDPSALEDDDEGGEFDRERVWLWARETVATGLTPARLAALLRAVDDNDDVHSFYTLAEEIEERDLHYFTCARNRRMRLSQASPVVDAPEGVTDEILEAVTNKIALSDALPDMVYDLLDAIAKGPSIVETRWRYDGRHLVPASFLWRRPEYYRFDDARNIRRVDMDDPRFDVGRPLEPGKFLVHLPATKNGHPMRGGLARVGSAAFVSKSFNLKDMNHFCELYGIPARIGRYKGTLSKADRRRLLSACIALGNEAAAILPEGQTIELLDGRRGTDIQTFLGSAQFWNTEMSKGWLGQTMTTDSGSSKSQAQVHYNVSTDLAKHDAQGIQRTVNRDLVRVFVDVNFEPQEVYPRLRWPVRVFGDLTKLTAAVTPLIDRGARIPERWLLEQIGAPLATESDRVLKAKPGGGQGPMGDRPGDTTPRDDDSESGPSDGDTGVSDE